MTELSKLLAEIDEADRNVAAAEHEMKDAMGRHERLKIHAQALHRALVLVGGKPAESGAGTKEATRPPADLCADAILEMYSEDLPRSYDDLHISIRDNFGARTGRAGLGRAHDRRIKDRADAARLAAAAGE